MKKIILSVGLLFFAGSIFAQNPIAKGQSQLNAGFGFSNWGLPVYFGVDYGIHEDITLGGEISTRAYHDYWRGERYNHNIMSISGNANFHFNRVLAIPPTWDLYAGLNVGFFIWNSPDDYHYDNHASGLGMGLQLGVRYYFSDKLGINMEFGGANAFSGGKIGISIRL